MARGPKKHLKRVAAPKSWMMNKTGGVFAVRPGQGPHKLRESIPLQVVLRDKLHLALNGREADVILHQKEGLVHIDGRVRRDPKFPVGLMDVVDLPKLGVAYRVLYDVKGRFTFIKLAKAEAGFKLCRVQKKEVGPNKIAYLITHDGRSIRFADKDISVNDTVRFNIQKREIEEFFPMAPGSMAFISDGTNRGRVGTISAIHKMDGMLDLVTLKDLAGHTFTTRINYVFVVGKSGKSSIALHRDKGVKKTIIEEAELREKAN